MCVIKAGLVFEPITEQAVETDMPDPDQDERDKDVNRQQHAGGGEQQRANQRMRSVVGNRADARTAEIAEETDVGCEK
jgi:hypothetical protein